MHNSLSISLCIFCFYGNEEKLVALIVYSSFRRVATSGIRNSSVATGSISWIKQAVFKWGVGTESLRIQHSTAAQFSYKNESHITRLVATEHVQNKHSLLESTLVQISPVTWSPNFNSRTALNFTDCTQSEYLYWKGGFIFSNLSLLQSIKPPDFIEKRGFVFNNWIVILIWK